VDPGPLDPGDGEGEIGQQLDDKVADAGCRASSG
jgi:hypothetical protein